MDSDGDMVLAIRREIQELDDEVAEMHSPLKVTATAAKVGFKAGDARM